MKRWLAAMMALVLVLMLLPVSSVAAQYATVKGGWLRLRNAPSFDAQTLASYYTGTVVEVLGTSGIWYRVRLSDGNTGYMHSGYLTAGANPPSTSGGNAVVVSHNGYGVRLRQGPGTNYRVIRKFPVGTPATILQSGSYWCKISIGGYTGYMMSQFLSTSIGGGSGSVTYVGDATVWSGNGYGVRLRTGPGKEYSKIGVYSVGTQVKIITKGPVWDYIQVGSRRGYMMNEFLIYNNNYTVNGVTINNLSPVVGNVLAVQSVTPSTATVTYEWLVKPQNGTETVKGTTAAYLVTEADVGSTIRLKVTGAGSYKGTAYSASTAAVVQTGTVDGLELNITTPYVGDVLRPVLTPSGATVTYVWTVGGVQKSNESTYTVTAADVGKTISLRVDGKYPFSGTRSATTNAVLDTIAPTITTTSLTNGTYQVAYDKQLTATGGGSMVWSLVGGSLPAGLSLSQSGAVTGTPTECGTKTFTVQVSNEKGKVTKELTLVVDPAKVNLPDVNGVAAPAKGETAATAITANDQYTGTITWTPALTDGAFAEATVYTAAISLTAKTNYTFTGLTASFFKVAGSTSTSCTIGGDGTTATVTAVFPATASSTAVKLDKPVVTGISQSGTYWVISWNPVTNASGYKFRQTDGTNIWHDCSSNSYTFVTAPQDGNTFEVIALGDGTAYSDSDATQYTYTLTPAPEPVQLDTPSGLVIAENSGVWTATWNEVANASGYRFRQVGGVGWHDLTTASYTFVNAPQNGDSYEIYAVGDGTAYMDSAVYTGSYTVSAPEPEPEPEPVPEPVKLDRPSGLVIAENGGVWTATWNAVSNASGYRFQQVGGHGWNDLSSTSYTFTNAPQDGDQFEIVAVGDGVNFTNSDVYADTYSAPAPVSVQLDTPSGFNMSSDGTAWTLTWNQVSNAGGYKLRQTNGSGTWHDCSTNSYTFVNEPQSGDHYEVYAVSNDAAYTDSLAGSYTY